MLDVCVRRWSAPCDFGVPPARLVVRRPVEVYLLRAWESGDLPHWPW